MKLFNFINDIRRKNGEFLLTDEFRFLLQNINDKEKNYFLCFYLCDILRRYENFSYFCDVNNNKINFEQLIYKNIYMDFISFIDIPDFETDFMAVYKSLMTFSSFENANIEYDDCYCLLFEMAEKKDKKIIDLIDFLSIFDVLFFLKDVMPFEFAEILFKLSENPFLIFSVRKDIKILFNNFLFNSKPLLTEDIFIEKLKFEFYALRRGHYNNLTIPEAKFIVNSVCSFEKYSDILLPTGLYN
ncbi:MAG: hypothetical protein WC002_06845 [Candidatus Muiribacteriota bacterium]